MNSKIEFKRETVDDVVNRFDNQANFIQNEFAEIEKLDQLEQKTTKLDTAYNLLNKLREFVNQQSQDMPAYELKRAQDRLTQLDELIVKSKEKIQPRKKFTFKKVEQTTKMEKVKPIKIESETKIHDIKQNLSKSVKTQNLKNTIIELNNDEVFKQDLEFLNLEQCEIKVFGNANTIRLHNLLDCRIFLGPVSTSVFIHNCSNCDFQIVCQQLRIHHTKKSIFRVQITSGGIIEDCNELKFTKFSWDYEGFKRDLASSDLRIENNNWDHIQDFNWLSIDEPSPNWSILNE